MPNLDATPWIAYRKPRPSPRLRLFCFPYAGGAASAFRGWSEALPEEIEVCPVQPPGREGRIREEPHRSMADLVTALDAGLADALDAGPHAFFGHSMGSVAAYELARRRRDAGRPEPRHLFASAHVAPPVPWEEEPLWDLPNPRFRERLEELNGTPKEVLEHPELMALVEPLLRADFQVNETYEHTSGEPLSCPVTAIGGVEDDEVSRENLARWQEITEGPFEMHVLPGDHFYLNGPAKPDLLRIIARKLLS